MRIALLLVRGPFVVVAVVATAASAENPHGKKVPDRSAVEIVSDLKSPSWEKHSNAIGDAGRLGPAVILVLIAEMRSGNDDLTHRVGEVAKRIGPAGVPAFQVGLHDSSPMARRGSAQALQYLGPAAAPARGDLAALLSDPDEYVRRFAAAALGGIGQTAAPFSQRLYDLARKENCTGHVAMQAAASLGQIGSHGHLGELLLINPAACRDIAVDGFSITGAAAVSYLMSQKEAHDDENFFREVSRVVERVRDTTDPSRRFLAGMLASKSADLRGRAAALTGTIGPERLGLDQNLLEVAVHDPSLLVRQHATQALGAIREDTSKSLPILLSALENSELRRHSVWGLTSLGKLASPAVPRLQRLLRSEKGDVLGDVLRAVGAIGPSASSATGAIVEVLNQHLHATTPDRYRVLEAVLALMQVHGAPALSVPAFASVLSHPDDQARELAASALAKLGTEAELSEGALIRALSDSDSYVVCWAKVALKRIGTSAALRAVGGEVPDERRCVRPIP